MKKLNRKGFTLIELLAVIVVLAVVLVVTVPAVLSSVRSVKLSQLHNLSVAIADWYNKAAESDELGLDKNILGNIPEALKDGKWHCLSSKPDTDASSIADIYKINSVDINLYGIIPSEKSNDHFYEPGEDDTVPAGYADFVVTQEYCSGIRIKNGKAEVYLIAKDNGKFDVGDDTAYAVSYGENGFTKLA